MRHATALRCAGNTEGWVQAGSEAACCIALLSLLATWPGHYGCRPLVSDLLHHRHCCRAAAAAALQAVVDLIEECIAGSPLQRPTAAQALQRLRATAGS